MRWRRSALIAAAAMLTACGPALADTILHLADTETVMAHPDELVATLRVEASAASAAATQQVVNNVMAAALARARQVAGVTAATQGYTGWQATQPQRWQASQILTLRSHDGPALLTLVGELQQKGLATSELSWQLSSEASRTARDQAMREALSALRARAEEAAGLLGLRFELVSASQHCHAATGADFATRDDGHGGRCADAAQRAGRGYPGERDGGRGCGAGAEVSILRGAPASSGIDQHTRIEHAARIERALRRFQRNREQLRPLAIVPGSMIASDGVVMGDRAA